MSTTVKQAREIVASIHLNDVPPIEEALADAITCLADEVERLGDELEALQSRYDRIWEAFDRLRRV